LFGVTPPGNADGYQNKGLVKKAIRKVIKIKGIKIDVGGQAQGGIRKVMKTKEGEKTCVLLSERSSLVKHSRVDLGL
jgi:hypothetical protein